MTDKLTVLVTGATGKQGGAVAQALLAKGHTVRGMTRNAYSESAYEIKALGVEPVSGDFDEPSTLRAACQGVDAVFAMGTPFEKGVETETEHGVALAAAAKEARVKHFVYSSVGSADQQTGVPHFDSKSAVEREIKNLDMPFTFIRPVYFMDNVFRAETVDALKVGHLAMPMPADRPLQRIAVEDVGRFAALVFERGAEFYGQGIDIAADELSGREVAQVLTDVTGKEISYQEIPLDVVRQRSEDVARMYEWFSQVGYGVSIKDLQRRYPEVGWQSFEAWAKKQDWRLLD